MFNIEFVFFFVVKIFYTVSKLLAVIKVYKRKREMKRSTLFQITYNSYSIQR